MQYGVIYEFILEIVLGVFYQVGIQIMGLDIWCLLLVEKVKLIVENIVVFYICFVGFEGGLIE